MGGESADSIDVLHVNADPAAGETTATNIERKDERIEATITTTADAAYDHVIDCPIDCIVSKYALPDRNGIELLRSVREETAELPFILFPDAGSEAIASRAISAGVTDYVRQRSESDQNGILAERIVNAVDSESRIGMDDHGDQRIREIAEHTNDILWMFSADWSELLFINSAYEEIWGRSIEQLRTQPDDFLNGIHPEDRDRVKAGMDRLSAGEPVDAEYRVNESEDYCRWVWVQGEPITDVSGSVVRVAGFVRDITDRKRRSQELQRSKEAYQQLIDISPEPIFIFTMDGELLYVNEAAVDFLAAEDQKALLGTPASDFVHPDSESVIEDRYRQLVENREPVPPTEKKLVDTNGDVKHAIIASAPVTYEGKSAIQTVATDITDRKTMEQELRAERDRFTTLFENLPSPVVYGIAKEGEPIIRAVNQRFEEVFGYDADAIKGENLDELIVPPDRDEEAMMINQEIMDGGIIREEVRRQAQNGLRDFELRVILDSESDPPEGYAIY
ncbi:MAG: PAS domain S-box protein, partial [Halobacteriales archaeon]